MLKEGVKDPKVKKYRKQITNILTKRFKDQKVKVYLYGSRATGSAHYASDIDFAVQSSDSISAEIVQAKEAFFESTIPYKVDMVNLDEINELFKENILNEGILFWKN